MSTMKTGATSSAGVSVTCDSSGRVCLEIVNRETGKESVLSMNVAQAERLQWSIYNATSFYRGRTVRLRTWWKTKLYRFACWLMRIANG